MDRVLEIKKFSLVDLNNDEHNLVIIYGDNYQSLINNIQAISNNKYEFINFVANYDNNYRIPTLDINKKIRDGLRNKKNYIVHVPYKLHLGCYLYLDPPNRALSTCVFFTFSDIANKHVFNRFYDEYGGRFNNISEFKMLFEAAVKDKHALVYDTDSKDVFKWINT